MRRSVRQHVPYRHSRRGASGSLPRRTVAKFRPPAPQRRIAPSARRRMIRATVGCRFRKGKKSTMSSSPATNDWQWTDCGDEDEVARRRTLPSSPTWCPRLQCGRAARVQPADKKRTRRSTTPLAGTAPGPEPYLQASSSGQLEQSTRRGATCVSHRFNSHRTNCRTGFLCSIAHPMDSACGRRRSRRHLLVARRREAQGHRRGAIRARRDSQRTIAARGAGVSLRRSASAARLSQADGRPVQASPLNLWIVVQPLNRKHAFLRSADRAGSCRRRHVGTTCRLNRLRALRKSGLDG